MKRDVEFLGRKSKAWAHKSSILYDALEMRLTVLLLRLYVEGHVSGGHGDSFQCHCRCGLFNVIRHWQSLLSCMKWGVVLFRHTVSIPSFWHSVEFVLEGCTIRSFSLYGTPAVMIGCKIARLSYRF
jgi:hypothetical protein